MTINDIRNEGFTFWNTVSLVTDVASLLLPAIPAGASHAIRAAKYANKAVNAADTAADIIKATSRVTDLWQIAKTAVKNVCSFKEDTKVATDEGDVEISEIEVGDYVLAWNEETGETGYYEVTDTFSHHDPVLTELIIDGEWVETTPEHPFYTLEEGWVPADELKLGMQVRQADGDYELVWLKWNIHETQEMYNLTIAEAHTYFVGKGQWLVHNSCGINLEDFAPKPNKGTAFSGVYDFDSGDMLLKPSGNTTLANGSLPPHTVPPQGGHAKVLQELIENNPSVTGQNVAGFTVFYEESEKLFVEFISGLNGPGRVLDIKKRQPIANALKNQFKIPVIAR